MGDADITLRHLARRRPEELVRALVPEGCPIEVLGWVDSQVTADSKNGDLVRFVVKASYFDPDAPPPPPAPAKGAKKK